MTKFHDAFEAAERLKKSLTVEDLITRDDGAVDVLFLGQTVQVFSETACDCESWRSQMAAGKAPWCAHTAAIVVNRLDQGFLASSLKAGDNNQLIVPFNSTQHTRCKVYWTTPKNRMKLAASCWVELFLWEPGLWAVALVEDYAFPPLEDLPVVGFIRPHTACVRDIAALVAHDVTDRGLKGVCDVCRTTLQTSLPPRHKDLDMNDPADRMKALSWGAFLIDHGHLCPGCDSGDLIPDV